MGTTFHTLLKLGQILKKTLSRSYLKDHSSYLTIYLSIVLVGQLSVFYFGRHISYFLKDALED